MIKKSFSSLRFSLKGLKTTWQEENSFRVGVFVAFVVVAFALYFDFSFLEIAICVLAITVVLSAEIINTAVEDICNKIEPNTDVTIGKIKDISAGFVLLSVVGAGIVGVFIFYHHFFQ